METFLKVTHYLVKKKNTKRYYKEAIINEARIIH